MDQLLASPQTAKLKEIWSLRETAELMKQALDQFSRVPFLTVSNSAGRGASDQSALFRPLLDDVVAAESYVDWRGPVGSPTEFLLCVRLSDVRAKLWSKNLQDALSAWKLGTIAGGKSPAAEAWSFKLRDSSASLSFSREGQWVVLCWGSPAMKLHAAALGRIKAGGRPFPVTSGHWLTGDFNLGRLKPWLPPLQTYQNVPVAHLSLSNHTDMVRTMVRLEFPQPHGWKGETWMIPTNFIRDSVVSFTSLRGIAPLLESLSFFKKLNLESSPNQVTFWAQSPMPFLSHFAVPMTKAVPELKRVAPLLPSLVLSNDPAHPLIGKIGWSTNLQSLMWGGLPVATPSLTPMRDRASGQVYMVGGLFPMMPGTNPAPAELFRQLDGNRSVVAYDWEITEYRLKHWRTLYQLLDIAQGHPLSGTNNVVPRWLSAVSSKLGNSVTEVTATSPNEMTLVRKSHLGFTGFELVSFGRWLDSPDFPKLSVSGRPHQKPTIKPRPKVVPPAKR